jgi:transposase
MRAYSVDLRERAVGAVAGGMPQSVAARTFGVGRATVQRWVRRQRAGNLGPAPVGGSAPRIGPAQAEALRAQVAAHPDATLAEHAERWEREQGVRVSLWALDRALDRLGITRKKRRSTPASRTR